MRPRGEGVHRQFPVGQIIAVGLDGAFGQRAPLVRGDVRERHERSVMTAMPSGEAAAAGARLPAASSFGCATDHRWIRNLDHVPVSPFARTCGAVRRRAPPPRYREKASGKIGKYRWMRVRFNSSGNVNARLSSAHGAGSLRLDRLVAFGGAGVVGLDALPVDDRRRC